MPSAALQVLIVEDDADSREAYRLTLELAGHSVRAAADAQEAIAIAADFTPNVAVIDLGLPGIGGFDLLVIFRSNPALVGCSYLAVTGYDGPTLQAKVTGVGFDDFLQKPIPVDRLIARVSALAKRSPSL